MICALTWNEYRLKSVPEKRKIRQLFLQILATFSENFLIFRVISEVFSWNFPRFFLTILEGSNRYFSRKKTKKNIYINFFREISCEVSRNYGELNIWFKFLFFSGNFRKFLTKYREIKVVFFSAELRRINSWAFLLGPVWAGYCLSVPFGAWAFRSRLKIARNAV